MKNINIKINENLVNEAKSKYYEDTLNTLADFIAMAPEYDYNRDNLGMSSWIKDLLNALKNDNNRLNEDSLNGKADPAAEIKKLKNMIVTLISDALNESVSTDYKLNFDND